MKLNFEFIKGKYVTLYNECKDFIIDPNKVWNKVVEENRSWTDTQMRLLYPFLVLILLCGFIGVLIENFFEADYDLFTHTMFAIAWPILLAIFLLIAALVLRPALQLYVKKPITFDRMVVFLTYAEIPLFLSSALFAILPMAFAVLIFFNFYSFYAIMLGYNIYFADEMGEEKKFDILTTSVTFVVIYFLTYSAWGLLAII